MPRVRVSPLGPKLDTRFDTMSIEAGVQFLFAKVPVCKGFHIPFNESRLYSNRGMVAVELFCILPMHFLIIGLWGVHWVQRNN